MGDNNGTIFIVLDYTTSSLFLNNILIDLWTIVSCELTFAVVEADLKV
jgi:hypothetical protein